MSPTADCPECGAGVEIAEDSVIGEIFQCEECGVDLEAVEDNPWKLARAPEEDEDWGE